MPRAGPAMRGDHDIGPTADNDAAPRAMSCTVYVVDDDEAVRLSLQALVGTRPATLVETFASGDDFLAAIESRERGVVLLDLHMPGTSGIDILAALVPLQRRFPVVMVTGQGDIALAVQAMRLGAVDFLEKPYDHELLFAAIDRSNDQILEGRAIDERSDGARRRIAELTRREREIFDLMVDGASNRAMADRLGLSVRTVEVHRANLLAKLELPSLSAVIRLAYVAGIRDVGQQPD